MNLGSKVAVSSMRRISLDGSAICFPLSRRKMSLGSDSNPSQQFSSGIKSTPPTVRTFSRRFSEDMNMNISSHGPSLLAFNSNRSQSAPKLERRSPREVRVEGVKTPSLRDPKTVFQEVWLNLQIQNHGELQFPKEIIFLSSAPGAGKDTNTPYILSTRKITAPPIVMSSLLNSSELQKIKNTGGLVSDEVVLTELLSEITKEHYRNGVIIDGFPRTNSQVNFVRLIAEKYLEINEVEPNFSVVVLQISEQESISRQLNRGFEIIKQNKIRALEGKSPLEVRPTDIDPKYAAIRYKNFSESYHSLMSLKKNFTFFSIDASGTKEEVKKNIETMMSTEESTAAQIFSDIEKKLESFSGFREANNKLAWQ